jgi:hypothetical protein
MKPEGWKAGGLGKETFQPSNKLPNLVVKLL